MTERTALAEEGAWPGKIREILKAGEGSAFARYRALTHPSGSILRFWLYELATMLLLPMPGGLGITRALPNGCLASGNPARKIFEIR